MIGKCVCCAIIPLAKGPPHPFEWLWQRLRSRVTKPEFLPWNPERIFSVYAELLVWLLIMMKLCIVKVPKFLKSGSGSKKYFRFAELFKDLNTDQRSWSRSFFVSDLKRIWSRSFFRRKSVKDLDLDPCFGKRSQKDLDLDPFSEVIWKGSDLDPFQNDLEQVWAVGNSNLHAPWSYL